MKLLPTADEYIEILKLCRMATELPRPLSEFLNNDKFSEQNARVTADISQKVPKTFS